MQTPDGGDIRRASTDDVPSIAAVFEAKRAEYEQYSPVFWRQAADARATHEPFLQMLVEQDGPVAFVQAGGDRSDVDGAIVALPRAEDWLVDDFGQGAVLAVVPVAAEATDRQEALRKAGYAVASEWYRFKDDPPGH